MVIDDFDLVRVSVAPDEAQSPLVIDPDAVLPGPVTLQGFQTVTRWLPQILKDMGSREHVELAQGGFPAGCKAGHGLALHEPAGVLVPE